MITLRPATMADRDLLLRWRNDPTVLQECGSTGEVSDWQHDVWLAKWVIVNVGHTETEVGDRPRRGLFIALEEERPVGTGRIDYDEASSRGCQIHYSLAEPERDKGLGKQLVHALVHKAKTEMGYATIGCEIRRGNLVSLVCAMEAGVNAVRFV